MGCGVESNLRVHLGFNPWTRVLTRTKLNNTVEKKGNYVLVGKEHYIWYIIVVY